MIDVEVELFDEVARAILEQYPKAYVSSEHVIAPPKFPAVSIIETNNLVDNRFEDGSPEQNMAAITYTVNVYSNSESSAKQECKGIMEIISDRMYICNMTRNMCSVIDNAADPTIYRMVARFTGLVDKNLVMYRR